MKPEWVEAVVDALRGDNCPEDIDDDPDDWCSCSDWNREAEVAIAAVEPLIRADIAAKVRERCLILHRLQEGDTGPCFYECEQTQRIILGNRQTGTHHSERGN